MDFGFRSSTYEPQIHHLLVPFSHLENGSDNQNAYKIFWGIHKIIHGKYLA